MELANCKLEVYGEPIYSGDQGFSRQKKVIEKKEVAPPPIRILMIFIRSERVLKK